MQRIIVEVSGGLVQHVAGVPSGVVVEVRDYDTEGVDSERLSTMGNGEQAIVSEYAAEADPDAGLLFEPIEGDDEHMRCPKCGEAVEVQIRAARLEYYDYAGVDGDQLQFSIGGFVNDDAEDEALVCQSCWFESSTDLYSFDLN